MSLLRARPESASTSDAIEFLRTRSLAMVVEAEIEELILTGRLAPGARLNENALASRLSVSRGPVREACRRLERAGLLEIVVNRGMYVRKLDLAQALELKDIRAALIPLVGRKAASTVTDPEIDELDELVQRMEQPAGAADLDSYFPLNLEFHAKLLDVARSPRIAEIYLSMNKELHLHRRYSLMSAEAPAASNEEHRHIVEGLRVRDPDRTVAAMLAHGSNARARLISAHQAGNNGAGGDDPDSLAE